MAHSPLSVSAVTIETGQQHGKGEDCKKVDVKWEGCVWWRKMTKKNPNTLNSHTPVDDRSIIHRVIEINRISGQIHLFSHWNIVWNKAVCKAKKNYSFLFFKWESHGLLWDPSFTSCRKPLLKTTKFVLHCSSDFYQNVKRHKRRVEFSTLVAVIVLDEEAERGNEEYKCNV